MGRRLSVVLAVLAAGLAGWLALGLSLADLAPRPGGLAVLRELAASALSPALRSEAAFVAEGTPSVLALSARAALRTVVFAAAAMSLALPAGLVLGFLGSSAWWADGERRARVAPLARRATRLLVVLLRSVHELLWAVLLLAAFGLAPATGVLAIAIPYAGVLGKVFAELLDETPRDSAEALRAAGAGPLAAFAFGLLPRALPDLGAYAFYRFECAVRSAAVLGFFGYPTLGFHIAASFENLHYGELWTYLYALLALVLLLEAWSARLRRRFVA